MIFPIDSFSSGKNRSLIPGHPAPTSKPFCSQSGPLNHNWHVNPKMHALPFCMTTVRKPFHDTSQPGGGGKRKKSVAPVTDTRARGLGMSHPLHSVLVLLCYKIIKSSSTTFPQGLQGIWGIAIALYITSRYTNHSCATHWEQRAPKPTQLSDPWPHNIA